MTKAALTRHPGVLRRPDSNIYQFGLRVPRDLLAHFSSKWAVRCSLNTSDLRQANDKARALQADWAQRFEALRSGRPPLFDAAALRVSLLAKVEDLLPGIDHYTVALSPSKREAEAFTIAWQRDSAVQEQAAGRVPEWAGVWLDKMSYARSPQTDAEALPYLVMLLEIYHESLVDLGRTFPLRVARLTARRALVATNSPGDGMPAVTVSPHAADKGHRIADALEQWAKQAERPAKTVGAFTRHAAQFADLMGDPVLAVIDRTEAMRFRDALTTWARVNGKTARTADNTLVSIRALVNVAIDRGWMTGNVFERLTVNIGGKESVGREPWTQDELRTLFDDPIWKAYRLPTAKKAGLDAAYWVPLIACYTGARVTEICQLYTDDLTIDAGAEVIEFRANSARGQALKTEGSWRAVPMHSELVRLGLPDYVASLSEGPLFPKLPTAGQNGAGGQFSKWFGSFKRDKGFDLPVKSLHSFRHLVATELRLAGATDAQADAVTGHSGEGMGRTVYAATMRRNAERLRDVIELLRYPGLSLTRHDKWGRRNLRS